jgi:hypothetical protein
MVEKAMGLAYTYGRFDALIARRGQYVADTRKTLPAKDSDA